MCMSDDEEVSATCYDPTSDTPGEAAAQLLSNNASTSTSLAGLFCPKCLLFWVAVLAIVLGIAFYSKKAA
jgi:hypothetical protein